MTVYTAFVQLADLPDGFLDHHCSLLSEQEMTVSGGITDWLQQSEWRCGRILLRYLVATAYDVPISDITIHSLSSGQLVAETPIGRVNLSHSRIPGMWAGATARAFPIGLDLVDISAFPVDVIGDAIDADTWATLEALAKVTQRGLDWALSANCYPVDGLVTAPNGETFQVTLLRELPPAVRGVVLGPADSALNTESINLFCSFHG